MSESQGSTVWWLHAASVVILTFATASIPAQEASSPALVAYSYGLPSLRVTTAYALQFYEDGLIRSIAVYRVPEEPFDPASPPEEGVPTRDRYASMALDSRLIVERRDGAFLMYAARGRPAVGGEVLFSRRDDSTMDFIVEGEEAKAVQLRVAARDLGATSIVYTVDGTALMRFEVDDRTLALEDRSLRTVYRYDGEAKLAGNDVTRRDGSESWQRSVCIVGDAVDIQEPPRGDPFPWLERHVIYGSGPATTPMTRAANLLVLAFSVGWRPIEAVFPLLNAWPPTP